MNADEKLKRMDQTISQNLCPLPVALAFTSKENFALQTPSRVLQSFPFGSLVQDPVPGTTQNAPSESSITDYLLDIKYDELLNDVSGTVQNNTCNST